MLSKLKEIVRLQENILQRVVLDFETATWSIMSEAFPWAEIRGCYFHYKRALLRYVIFL
jgi:transposase-like protein